MRPPCLVLLAVLATTFIGACRQRAPEPNPLLQALVAQPASPYAQISKESWSDVRKFYDGRGHTPVWTDQDGPSEEAGAAVDVVRGAGVHGLDPAAYGDHDLTQLHAGLLAGDEESPARAQQLAELD